ncbi:MAG: OprO/OprP family phosphate-selective porin [Bryobacteraceae bacterium]
MKTGSMIAALLVSTAWVGSPQAAEPADTSRQIQAMEKQIRDMQQQLEEMKTGTRSAIEAIAKEKAAREEAEKAAREAALEAGGTLVFDAGKRKVIPAANPKVVQSGTNRFTLSSPDNAWTIAPTGRIHFDFGGYLNQSPEGTTGPGTVAGGKLTSGVNVRRARFGVTGRALNDFTYSLILDAGGATDGTASINTASIGYTGVSNTIFEMGYFANFFVLEEASSSNDSLFIERATPSSLASSFSAGDPRSAVGFRTWEPNYWFGAYLTGSTPNTAHALTKRTLAAYTRATYQIIETGLESLHIGVGATHVFDVANSGVGTAHSVTLSERPELRIDPTVILNTGPLGTVANPVTSVQVYTAETAAAFDGLFFQAEYFNTVINRRGKTDAKFDTGYGEISYTIGGRRTYTANCGCYSGVNPVTPFNALKGGTGALEFAARISVANLTDQFDPTILAAAQPNFVNGGKQTNYTLGLNWYWNSNMLWKFNYIHTDFDKFNPRTATIATPIPLGLKVDSISGRFQVMF